MSDPTPTPETKLDLFRHLRDSVLDGPGALGSVERRGAYAGEDPPVGREWIRRVHERAATIEDAHLDELHQANLNEEQIFELTVCAAVGAADRRLRAALRTLGREEP